MRNIYQTSAHQTRNYQYPSGNSINAVSNSRYPPMSNSPYHVSGQHFAMSHSGPAHVSPMGVRQDASPDDWYNKGFSALRMNAGHHPNLSTPMLPYASQ